MGLGVGESRSFRVHALQLRSLATDDDGQTHPRFGEFIHRHLLKSGHGVAQALSGGLFVLVS